MHTLTLYSSMELPTWQLATMHMFTLAIPGLTQTKSITLSMVAQSHTTSPQTMLRVKVEVASTGWWNFCILLHMLQLNVGAMAQISWILLAGFFKEEPWWLLSSRENQWRNTWSQHLLLPVIFTSVVLCTKSWLPHRLHEPRFLPEHSRECRQ